MKQAKGWMLDIYDDQQDGLVLWLITDDGLRLRLRQHFTFSFCFAGSEDLKLAAQSFLHKSAKKVHITNDQGRDIFQPQPVDLIKVETRSYYEQQKLFKRLARLFPDLDFYNADIQIALQHAARFDSFPLAYCWVEYDPDSMLIRNFEVLESPWDLDLELPPIRVLSLRPDSNPSHRDPQEIIAVVGKKEYHFALHPERSLLVNLRALLRRVDPDIILTVAGDTWLLQMLLEAGKRHNILLPLNRENGRGVIVKSEGSYFSYGQIIYRGQQIILYGRCHIDCHNAMMWQSYDLEGALESARITALPLQVAARVSPGTGISSMQITTALRNDILVPWRKQQVEGNKTALDLIHFDQGGLVYQPLVGLHFDVGMIDFVSMYPSIMVHSNISPENPKPTRLGSSDLPPGLVPLTLAPLLEKRIALKQRALDLPHWDPRRKLDKARSAAHKWLLVTCFGYLGYKNARFGRIEAHEAVTTWGREALLRAKEAAEDMGFRVLHMYVDGLWVKKDGCREPQHFAALLDEIARRTSLPIALDGVYRWVAFLHSRVDKRWPVPNRYFGVFQDGSIKVRGIDLRRRDVAPFVAEVQEEMLRCLAQGLDEEKLKQKLPQALDILRKRIWDLRRGKIPMEKLLVGKKLSRELEGYRVFSDGAKAVTQLQGIGKSVRPGQRVRLLYTLGEPGVHAWDLPYKPDIRSLNLDYYETLLLRAASNIVQPLGIDEETLQILVRDDMGLQLSIFNKVNAGLYHPAFSTQPGSA